MYVSSFCKLMRINVLLFSQHGIKVIKEFENARVRVSPCGQFQQPIQRPCHTQVVLQSSRSLIETKPPPATFTSEIFRRPPFRPKSTPTGAPPSDLPSGGSIVGNTFPRTDLRSGAEIHASVRGGACDTVLTRASSSRCVCRRQAHPSTPHARRRRRSPSFSLFLSDHYFCVFLSPESPLFLCFLKLYDIFRTVGVVFVDSY